MAQVEDFLLSAVRATKDDKKQMQLHVQSSYGGSFNGAQRSKS